MRTTRDDIHRGYDLIKQCIDYVLKRDNIKFISSELAPSTYKDMRQYRDDFGQFLVYSGGDHGFLGKEYNIKFRALHDAMHYENELTFNFDHEIVLSDLTALEFHNIVAKMGHGYRDCLMVEKIIRAEIEGQIEYYKENGEYVKDQRAFILACLESMERGDKRYLEKQI